MKTKIVPCIRCRATWTVFLSHRRSFTNSNSTSLFVHEHALMPETAGPGESSGMVPEVVPWHPSLLFDSLQPPLSAPAAAFQVRLAC